MAQTVLICPKSTIRRLFYHILDTMINFCLVLKGLSIHDFEGQKSKPKQWVVMNFWKGTKIIVYSGACPVCHNERYVAREENSYKTMVAP